MSGLRHPKLIHLHDAFEDDNEMVMIHELLVIPESQGWIQIICSLAGGELFEKAADEHNRMSEKEVINYMRQICEAVQVNSVDQSINK